MNILLTTSAAPKYAPFFTSEKRIPLGVGFLISILKNAGHRVYFIDNYLEPSRFLEDGYIERNKIDLVGIYSNTVCFDDTLRMVKKLHRLRKKRRWNGKIIVGGPHTSVAAETLPSYIDHIVQGEGERAILEIVEGRVQQQIYRAKPIEDLDTLPRPAYDVFMKLPYDFSSPWAVGTPVISMNTSRGCPFECSFCSVASIWGRGYNCFSAARVYEDVTCLQSEFGAKTIYFREDNFTLKKKRLVEFCDLILKDNNPVKWICETRVDNLDGETVKLMSGAGCIAWYVGVESGCPRMLEFFRKKEAIEQFEEGFRLARENGIRTYASFVVGAPTETREELRQTLDFSRRLKSDFTGFNVFTGLPGSYLYKYVKENKLYNYQDSSGLLYIKDHDKLVRYFYGENAWRFLIPRWLVIKRLLKSQLYNRDVFKMAVCLGLGFIDKARAGDLITNRQNVDLACVKFLGYSRYGHMLDLYFQARKRMRRNFRIFAHAYPEEDSLLSADRKEHGFINLDHEPIIPTTKWDKEKIYISSIDVSKLLPGKYRFKIGLFSDKVIIKVLNEDTNSIDLGWIDVE